MNHKRRHSIRLTEYNYSMAGAYYVTICTQNRECVFGEIKNGQMALNNAGYMINKWWQKLSERFSNIEIDQYVIMPNHLHGIINIVGAIPCNRPNNITNEINNRGENVVSPLQNINTYVGLGQYISWFKRMSTTEYIRNVRNNTWSIFNKRIWQRNYYEHIIRGENDLDKIREYIRNNPLNWQEDNNNPINLTRADIEPLKVEVPKEK